MCFWWPGALVDSLNDVSLFGALSLQPTAFNSKSTSWQMKEKQIQKVIRAARCWFLPLGANLFSGFRLHKGSAQEIVNISTHEHAEDHQARKSMSPRQSDIICLNFHSRDQKIGITLHWHKTVSIAVYFLVLFLLISCVYVHVYLCILQLLFGFGYPLFFLAGFVNYVALWKHQECACICTHTH